MKKHIPNFITCLNIVCGFMAIVLVFDPNTRTFSPLLILIAAIFDFLDGFAARMLKAYSPLGKQMDSLADMISFGVAPAMLFAFTINEINPAIVESSYAISSYILPFIIATFMVVFSALRLAKFNIDDSQTYSFKGLPTPSNAMFIAGLPFVLKFFIATDPYLVFYSVNIIALLLAIMLVSPIPLFSLKMQNYGWKGNQIKFILLIISLILVVVYNLAAISFIIIIYIILSLINNIIKRNEIQS